MKTKFGIVGCGFLGNIVADAWKNGLLPDYELVGVTSRTRASAEKTAETVGCAVCDDVDALLALEPEYIVETASVEAVRAMAVPVLKRGVNLVIISIGAFADLDFYEQVKAAAVEGGAKVHLASGAIGGFDVLQTVTLMAEAQKLAETAGIETHTGAKGFRNTPVWADHLLTDTEKTTVFTGNAKQAIATFPRRVNVAVATSLATTGPEITEKLLAMAGGADGAARALRREGVTSDLLSAALQRQSGRGRPGKAPPQGMSPRAQVLFAAAARYAYHQYGLTPVFVAVEKHLDPGAGQMAARGLDIPCYFLNDAGSAGTIIGALSRMEIVVSMRLHALIFAAGQGIPLAGVVYDPKVSAFLRYIGQEQFVDLAELTGQNLCAMMDQCVAQAAHPEAQAAAVRNLQAMEQKNVEVARRLLKG